MSGETKYLPLVVGESFELERPSLKDNSADWDRLIKHLNRRGFDPISSQGIPLDRIKSISSTVRKRGFSGRAILAYVIDAWDIIEIGDSKSSILGAAFDLGTTRIAFYLVDLLGAKILYETSISNPQIPFGEDILTRINYATTPEKLRQLQLLLIDAFNSLMVRVAEELQFDTNSIYAMAVAGNTTMSHFFLGLDPSHICREPYIPVVNNFPILRAKDLGLKMNPEGIVYVFPNVGSYFGGDAVAGILASGMHRQENVSVFVDVGTNAEVVLGNRDWMIACAGAAGPALEGGVVERGMMAMPGAIDRIRIDPETLELTYHTIGDQKPLGICGSGLIDLIAEMFQAGILTIQGKINTRIEHPRIVATPDGMGFVVAFSHETADGRDLIISDIDIGILLKSKAAMYTILNIIARKVGLDIHDIDRFYVAGTFGNHIDPQMAIRIGMLPDIPIEKFVPLGNTSGQGASMLLLNRNMFQEIREICAKLTYVELNVNVELIHEFRGALFLPHTDPSLFPSVKIPQIAKG
ncbi:MAG: ASKHA domain-containing protein [Syntrophobacterales bacterium]|nr:ASKHA domain-containing protein [Syntrophobacterales bacterium]